MLWTPRLGQARVIVPGGAIEADGDSVVHRSPAIRGQLIVWISDVYASAGFLRTSQLWVRDAGPDGRWNTDDDFGTFLVDEINGGRLSDAVVEGDVIGALAQRWFDEPPFVVAYSYERAAGN